MAKEITNMARYTVMVRVDPPSCKMNASAEWETVHVSNSEAQALKMCKQMMYNVHNRELKIIKEMV